MITVIIKDNGEPNVIKLTYENIWRELKDIPDAELVVAEHWMDAINPKNIYTCFLESDCLVSSGYFSSQLGLFKKNPMFRKLSMLSSSAAVNYWHNRFFGYTTGNDYTEAVIPVREKKSRSVYPVRVGYVPGAIMRTSMLIEALKETEANPTWEDDLVFFSTKLSLAFWQQGDGNPVHINPNTTYVSTEEYVNDIGKFEHDGEGLLAMFKKESI